MIYSHNSEVYNFGDGISVREDVSPSGEKMITLENRYYQPEERSFQAEERHFLNKDKVLRAAIFTSGGLTVVDLLLHYVNNWGEISTYQLNPYLGVASGALILANAGLPTQGIGRYVGRISKGIGNYINGFVKSLAALFIFRAVALHFIPPISRPFAS